MIRNWSINRKLRLIAIGTSSLAMLLSSAGLLVYDLITFRSNLTHEMASQAEIIGSASKAAIVFSDEAAAREILNALQGRHEIIHAALYDADGRLFSESTFQGMARSNNPHLSLADGVGFENGHMRIVRPIVLNQTRIGTVFIESDMREWNARLFSFTAIVIAFMSISGLVAFVLSGRLRKQIGEPILNLQKAIHHITAEKDYSVQVTQTSSDEIGALVVGFNTMLGTIKQHEENLRNLNETLEERVAERSAAAEQRARDLAMSEQELQEQKTLLQSVLDSMGDGVIVSNRNGRIVLANPAASQILGDAVQNPGQGMWYSRFSCYKSDMTTPYYVEEHPFGCAARGISIPPTEIFVRGPEDPGGLWLSVIARPLKEYEGFAGLGMVVFRDITEWKQIEERLRQSKELAEQASRTKSAFLANMSHELRTPLNAIIGYSEMLQEDSIGKDEQLTADLDKINTAGKHLLSIINDILDLSKIEAGRIQLEIAAFDLVSVIGDVMVSIKPLALKNESSIEILAPSHIDMVGDSVRIRQVLTNLASNACKFTHRGIITITCGTEHANGEEWISLAVRDTGIGIQQDQIQRLFEPFLQADVSITRRYGGTGLGLAISRKFCHMMGGEITVDSELGNGSVFTMRLPRILADSPAPIEYPGSHSSLSQTAFGNPRVVVVDDDPAACDLLARLLRRDGYEPICCSNAYVGLEQARQLAPCAITLDIEMDAMDGWTALSELKQDPVLRAIPVILISITDEKSRAMSLGAFEYLTKPVVPQLLSDALKRARLTLITEEIPANAQDIDRRG